MPFFSVIIPTYNREKYILEAVDSVLGQTCGDLEVVVVDDGSKDGTETVMREKCTDPRVRYFRKENGGASAARNFAIEHATGEWLAFLDSDDLWRPGKLERAKGLIDSTPELDFIHTAFAPVGEEHESVSLSAERLEQMGNKEFLLSSFAIKTSALMVRSSVVREHGVRFGQNRTCDDYIFFWKALCVCDGVAYLPFDDTVVRISNNNITLTHTTVELLEGEIAAMDDVLDWMRSSGVEARYRAALENLKYWQLRNLLSCDILGLDAGKFIAHAARHHGAYGLSRFARIVASAARVVISRENREWLRKYATQQYG